jgi:hypothetical protein
VNSSIFGQIEASVQGYLTEITRRVQVSDGHAAATIARSELPRIAAALQAVLNEHKPDQRGRCRTCRRRLFRRAPSPCRAYLTAHLCLLPAEDGAQAGSDAAG